MQKPSLWAARKDSAYTDEAALPNRVTNIARVRIYLSICELVMFFQKILFNKMLSEIALIHKKNVRLISPALKRAGVLAYHFILKNLQLLICIPFSSCQLPIVMLTISVRINRTLMGLTWNERNKEFCHGVLILIKKNQVLIKFFCFPIIGKCCQKRILLYPTS